MSVDTSQVAGTAGNPTAANGRPHPRLAYIRPQARATAPAVAHPDERLSQAVRSAWADGYAQGEREHHVAGWRTGVWHGLLAGIAIGAAAAFAAASLLQLAATTGAA